MVALPGLPARRDERGPLLAAAIVAVLLHGTFLLVPLPRTSPAVAPATTVTPPRIVDLSIPPPPLPETPRIRTAATTPRRIPVPETDPPPLEPLADPAPVLEALPPVDPAFALLLPEDPPPPAPAADRVFSENETGLVPPSPLPDRVEPVYPESARRAGLAGRVVLRVVVGPDGSVESVDLLSASRPDLGFSHAAIAAVSRWGYRPGLYRGRPVAVSMTVVVDFSLR